MSISILKGVALVGAEVTSTVTLSAQVIVNSLSDFPTPVAGIITPADDTSYKLGQNVVIGNNRIVGTPGTSWKIDGLSGVLTALIGTDTSGPLVDISGCTFASDFVSYVAPATVNAIEASSAGVCFLHRCVFVTCDKAIQLDSPVIFNMSDMLIQGTNSGILKITGTPGSVSGTTVQTSSNTVGPFLDLDTSVISEALNFSVILLHSSFTGDLITGLANNANLGAGVIASIRGCSLLSAGAGLTGITRDDEQFLFLGNDGIADSKPSGFLSLSGNVTDTTFAMAGDTNAVAGTWTIGNTSQCTGNASGLLDFSNLVPSTGDCAVTGTIIKPAGGSANDYDLCFFKNGTALLPGIIRVTLKADSTPFSLSVPTDIEENDTFQLFVTAIGTTSSVRVTHAQFITE